MSKDCYDIETHTCDGSCQGCSNCPIAAGLNPSRRMMKLYFKDCEKHKEEWEKFIAECHNDPEYMAEINALVDNFFKATEMIKSE